MGTRPYQLLGQIANTYIPAENTIAVEIGSERGEGSTAFIRDWCKRFNIEFHTVDVLDHAKKHFETLQQTDGIAFHVVNTGHEWCRDRLPVLNKPISILYLDNFDWIDPVNLQYQWLHDQIAAYAERGVVMNNENCQEEHRLQAVYCLPHMAESSIVIIDDTWQDYNSPTGWNGKCGTAIPVFLQAGYTAIYGSFGVLLGRGVDLTMVKSDL